MENRKRSTRITTELRKSVQAFRDDERTFPNLLALTQSWAGRYDKLRYDGRAQEIAAEAIAARHQQLRDPAVPVEVAVRELTQAIGRARNRLTPSLNRQTISATNREALVERAVRSSRSASGGPQYGMDTVVEIARRILDADPESDRRCLNPRDRDLVVDDLELQRHGIELADPSNLDYEKPDSRRKAGLRARRAFGELFQEELEARFDEAMTAGDDVRMTELKDLLRRLGGQPDDLFV